MTRLMPGGPVPDLEVALAGGGTWKLSDQKPETFTVVEVYRGLHCPRCKLQLLDMDHKVARYAETWLHVDRDLNRSAGPRRKKCFRMGHPSAANWLWHDDGSSARLGPVYF